MLSSICAYCSSLTVPPNVSIAAICWSSASCCPTSVDSRAYCATPMIKTATPRAPSHFGRAATAANVSRGEKSTPTTRDSSPGCGPAEEGGVIVSGMALPLTVPAEHRHGARQKNRDTDVDGQQTCRDDASAHPVQNRQTDREHDNPPNHEHIDQRAEPRDRRGLIEHAKELPQRYRAGQRLADVVQRGRSEERRVGKECRARWSRCHERRERR